MDMKSNKKLDKRTYHKIVDSLIMHLNPTQEKFQ